MAWLSSDGQRVAALELATSFPARSRGLLGRDGIDGALLIKPGASVHTFGMRFPIDVAFCDRDLVVRDVVTMPRNRLGRTRLRSRAVLEAEAGSFARWGIGIGSKLGIDDD